MTSSTDPASLKMLLSFIAILSAVNALVMNPTGTFSYKRMRSNSGIRQRFSSPLYAEKPASTDRSASVCVAEFFSSSGKLSVPAPESRLSSIRTSGVSTLNSIKLPFGKDEAWR
jgi:hypothetical protein